MNRKEHLLLCLIEECSKVANLAIDEGGIGASLVPDTTNEENIQRTFIEAIAVMELLQTEVFNPVFNTDEFTKIVDDKIESVNIEYAKNVGTVTE